MGKAEEEEGIQGKRSEYANERFIDERVYASLCEEYPELLSKNGEASFRTKNLARVLADKRLSRSNRERLLEFNREKEIEGLSLGSRYNYLYNLKSLAVSVRKNFGEMTEEDLKKYLAKKSYLKSPEFKICIRRFFQWAYGLKDGEYPKVISWLRLSFDKKRKLPEEMLTQEDVLALVKACDNERDKAIVMVLYDTGMRAGELVSLEVKHFQPDKYGGCLLIPDGKTGSRKVRLTLSLPTLRNWLNNHPNKDKPNSALFPLQRDYYSHIKNVNYLGYLLNQLKRRSGLKKRLYSHLFRHSRATEMASEFSEQELKMFFGWTAGSNMPANYIHMSFNNLDRKILAKEGLLEEKDKEKKLLEMKVCSRCGTRNSADAVLCSSCSFNLESEKLMLGVLKELVSQNTPEATAVGKAILKQMGGVNFEKDGKKYRLELVSD
ncbi:MAG: tyrosine-type recombinase/integrase [Candidatus Micrarchaeota archaeon]